MKKDIVVPKAGLTMTEAAVGTWLISEGDTVQKDQVVLELTTDKIAIEITSPYDGSVVSILKREGENVKIGESLAILETHEEAESTLQHEGVRSIIGTRNAYDVAVIGAGSGGYVAAIRAAQLGGKVALVEQRALGGTCLNIGCIPTKILLRASELIKLAKVASKYGVYFDEPRIDYSRLMDYKDTVIKKLQNGIAGLIKKNKIDLFSGKGKILDANTIEITLGEHLQTIEARQIIVATGSSPNMPEIPGLQETIPMTSNEALIRRDLPRSVAIVGAGAIGCEFAGIYSPFGTEVTLIESAAQILPGMDHDLSAHLAQSLRNESVRIITSAQVSRVFMERGVKFVVVETAQGTEEIGVDEILLATGRKPNVGALRELGIQMAGDKIAVDEQLRTSIPSVYAVGDVNGDEFLAHVASAQGLVAAEAAMGMSSKIDSRTVTRCIYTSPEIASIGLTEQQAEKQGYDYQLGKYLFEANGKALTYGEGEGFVKVLRDKRYGEILGVHIVGPHATELIGEAVMAIHLEATAEEFVLAIHAHPTLSETLVEAILNSIGRGIHS